MVEMEKKEKLANFQGGELTSLSIGEMIREKRIALGLKQEELGYLMGFTNPNTAAFYVSQIERNVKPVPLKKLRKVARALQIPLDRFIP